MIFFLGFTNTSSYNTIKNKRYLLNSEFILKHKIISDDFRNRKKNYFFILQKEKLIIKSCINFSDYYNRNINDTINLKNIKPCKISYFNLQDLPKGNIIEKKLGYDINNNIVCIMLIDYNQKKIECTCPDFVYFCVEYHQFLE